MELISNIKKHKIVFLIYLILSLSIFFYHFPIYEKKIVKTGTAAGTGGLETHFSFNYTETDSVSLMEYITIRPEGYRFSSSMAFLSIIFSMIYSSVLLGLVIFLFYKIKV